MRAGRGPGVCEPLVERRKGGADGVWSREICGVSQSRKGLLGTFDVNLGLPGPVPSCNRVGQVLHDLVGLFWG